MLHVDKACQISGLISNKVIVFYEICRVATLFLCMHSVSLSDVRNRDVRIAIRAL